MTALIRAALSPLHAVLNLRYGASRETCTYCLEPKRNLDLHILIDHAGDQE